MFRPVNRSSSGLKQNKSKVLLENCDPNILYSCKQMYQILHLFTTVQDIWIPIF